jgi:hypothetical protein
LPNAFVLNVASPAFKQHGVGRAVGTILIEHWVGPIGIAFTLCLANLAIPFFTAVM